MSDPLAEFTALDECWCSACMAKLGKVREFYVLCPDCGNKRCPKAANHEHDCTRSNDSGQIGSTYGEPCPKACCDEIRRQREEQLEWLERINAVQGD